MPRNTFDGIATVQDINRYRIKKLEASGLRPGIKALFYNPQSAEVLLGTLPLGYPLRFNLPGGGIDKGQTAATALCREIDEELDIKWYVPEIVLPLPVVAHGYLPFKRDEFLGKYEFIVAVPNTQLESIKAQPGSKMQFYPVMSFQEAVAKVVTLKYGGPEMVWLYKAAFQSIRELLYP